MRLREGESNLLAGLVREEDRKVLRGFPGLMRIPILKDILGGTEDQITSTDIVILLTPRIVRTHELTQEHLNPIYIGSQMNLGLTGPTPVIAAPSRCPRSAEPAADAPPRRRRPPGCCAPTPPGGASPPAPRCRPRRRRRADAGVDADAGHLAGAARLPPTPTSPRRPRRAEATPAPAAAARRPTATAQITRDHARARVPGRRRPLHGADRDQQRLAAVADERLADLQPGR